MIEAGCTGSAHFDPDGSGMCLDDTCLPILLCWSEDTPSDTVNGRWPVPKTICEMPTLKPGQRVNISFEHRTAGRRELAFHVRETSATGPTARAADRGATARDRFENMAGPATERATIDLTSDD